MSVLNSEVAEKFNELADLLEINDANPFRVRAYRNAAQVIANLPHEVADLVAADKDLTELPGIGKDLAEKIAVIVKTGDLPLLKEMHQKTPIALSDMLRIPDLGPQRIKHLYQELNIKTIADLKKAVAANKVSQLEGFGEKTQAKIKTALQKFTKQENRLKFSQAEKLALALITYLKALNKINETAIAGSLRRCRETIGDLDILVATKNNLAVIEYFLAYPDIKKIISKGETRVTVLLRNDIQVDLRIVAVENFGSALQYFTGSKEHNIAVRTRAVKRNLKINEYGVFKDNKRIAGKTEAEIYQAVNLPYIAPELRENRGEIEAAAKNKLPKLITLADIRGDLHCHTNYSDGHDDIATMATAAQQLGYEYLAITDHSRHVTIANGIDEKKLAQQIAAIDKINAKFKNFQILKSIEVDILDDGSLDLSDSILKELDFTVCAIHYKFNLPREQQTERVLRAMDNPYFNIFAHPTGRLINKRDPYDIDLEKIMRKAKECGCILELNAQPDRLDLNDIHCQMAKEIGIKLAISTDAHNTATLNYMQYGINQARRGWLEPKDVINTHNLSELKKLLRRN